MASAEPIELVRSRIEEIDPADAREELAAGDAVLVDTREPNEWDEAHLEGATLVPPATVADRIEEVAPDRSQRVVLYCRVGNRSARAADLLESELGYEDVASIAGGIEAWQQAGLPVVAPRGLSAEQRMRYSRHTCSPRSASRASSSS